MTLERGRVSFLEDIESSFAFYFQEYGPLVLEIQPYALSIEGEVVYEEMDREKKAWLFVCFEMGFAV